MNPLESAKAYVALLGAIATALQGVFTADSTPGRICLIITVIASAVATWVVPNAEAPGKHAGT